MYRGIPKAGTRSGHAKQMGHISLFCTIGFSEKRKHEDEEDRFAEVTKQRRYHSQKRRRDAMKESREIDQITGQQ